jgi:hypothetical protein
MSSTNISRVPLVREEGKKAMWLLRDVLVVVVSYFLLLSTFYLKLNQRKSFSSGGCIRCGHQLFPIVQHTLFTIKKEEIIDFYMWWQTSQYIVYIISISNLGNILK